MLRNDNAASDDDDDDEDPKLVGMDDNSPALSCVDDEYSSLRNDDAGTDDDEEDEDSKLVGMNGNSPALSMVLTKAIFSAIDGTNDEDEDDEDEEEEEEDPIDVVTSLVKKLTSAYAESKLSTASASESAAPLTIMSSACKITSVEKRSFISS